MSNDPKQQLLQRAALQRTGLSPQFGAIDAELASIREAQARQEMAIADLGMAVGKLERQVAALQEALASAVIEEGRTR